METVSIIISPDNALPELITCVDSIRTFINGIKYEIIVVERGADEEIRQWLTEQKDIITPITDKCSSQAQSWNSGLEVASGDYVLLLHADTILTPNLLPRLLHSLELSPHYAGVGPVSNQAGENQTIPVNYATIDELLIFADKLEDGGLTLEDTLILSDFCVLLKKSVIDQLGGFDEKIEGSLILADFSLRLVEVNYKLAVNRSAFVHHEDSSKREGEDVPSALSFYKKWGFPWSYMNPQANILTALNNYSTEDALSVLEIGSGCGATLLNLRQQFPQAHIHGIEKSERARGIARHLVGNEGAVFLHSDLTELDKDGFDLVILRNNTSNIVELVNFLQNIIHYATPTGQVLVDFPNIRNRNVIQKILRDGIWREGMNFWSLSEISIAFEEAGFQELNVDYVLNQETNDDFILKESTLKLSGHELPEEWNVSNFIISATREVVHQGIHAAFDHFIENPDEAALSTLLEQYSMDQIISLFSQYKESATELLNTLAMANFEKNVLDEVLPYLTKAYELSPKDPNTLFNLGRIMHFLGEQQSAVEWFKKIPNKSPELNQWIHEIETNLTKKVEQRKKLKYYLLRIEYYVEPDHNIDQFFTFVRDNGIKCDEVLEVVESEIVHKSKTLTQIARSCYAFELYDWIIPMYKRSLEEKPDDRETLVSFGLNLIKLNAIEDAYKVLIQIREPNREISNLIFKLGEALTSQSR
ncbi:glycosyltransferase [Paenibacillus sp. M1]|uniref:Glycosyltransferase n=1 Tax=Paenibacillus haidiansis TaxID=1574488 RepID=A0ABU7VXU5_9BACL